MSPCLLQDLPPEEVDQELIEDGQWEEILTQPCPPQYRAIREEDVRSIFVLCWSASLAIVKGLRFVCKREVCGYEGMAVRPGVLQSQQNGSARTHGRLHSQPSPVGLLCSAFRDHYEKHFQ